MNNSAISINFLACNNFLVKKKKYSSLDKAITFFCAFIIYINWC